MSTLFNETASYTLHRLEKKYILTRKADHRLITWSLREDILVIEAELTEIAARTKDGEPADYDAAFDAWANEWFEIMHGAYAA
jgi:hypothetical protein